MGVASLLKEINWIHAPLLLGTPALAVYGLMTTAIQSKTLAFAVAFYFFTGLGITCGYHRLWSHRAFQAHPIVKYLLLVAGTGAFEGSIRWWCRDHRAHHRYTDTDKDPYNAKRGFFYSHIGWMLVKQDPKRIGKANIADLNADWAIRWQHRNYLWLAPLISFVLPSIICGFGWGDFRGGFYLAGIARLVFVHHATFCVNSLAHTLGEQTFDDDHTPRDHFLTALVTLGEGYHNFHHLFANDYRNGIRFLDYDPTKWLINFCKFFGLAWDVKVTPDNEIDKAKYTQQKKLLDEFHRKIDWGVSLDQLPVITTREMNQRNQEGTEMLLVVDGVVVDVKDFLGEHPGGPEFLKAYLGKDASAAFGGEVHSHSVAARNRLLSMRAGRFSAGRTSAK